MKRVRFLKGTTGLLFFIVFMASGCATGYREPDTSQLFPSSIPPPPGSDQGSRDDSPRRVASLRLTEQGRGELDRGDLKKAMDRFEKAIGLDAKNPTAYYFFADARYREGDFRQSLVLLDKAEQLLSGQTDWLIKVYLLEGDNFDAMGNKSEAAKRYQKVLGLAADNSEAIKRLGR